MFVRAYIRLESVLQRISYLFHTLFNIVLRDRVVLTLTTSISSVFIFEFLQKESTRGYLQSLYGLITLASEPLIFVLLIVLLIPLMLLYVSYNLGDLFKLSQLIILPLSLSIFIVVNLIVIGNRDRMLEEIWSSSTLDRVDMPLLITDEPHIGMENVRVRGRILGDVDLGVEFSLPWESDIEIGDICIVNGRVEEIKNFDDFDYKSYLFRRGIQRKMTVREFDCKPYGAFGLAQNLRIELVKFKHILIAQIEKNLPEPQASLLAGVVFGQDRAFSKEFESAVLNSGTSHIVAASGYNIGFVANWGRLLFRRLGVRWQRISEMLFVIAYSLMCGLSPSIMRAALMYCFVRIFSFLGIYIPTSRVLFIIATMMILHNPRILLDVGFQLSFAATYGLVVVSKHIHPFISFVFPGIKEDSVLLSTLTAFLCTLPILLLNFGKFQWLAIFSNILILPVIESTMLLGVLAVALSFISLQAARVIYALIWFQLKYMEIVVVKITNLFVPNI